MSKKEGRLTLLKNIPSGLEQLQRFFIRYILFLCTIVGFFNCVAQSSKLKTHKNLTATDIEQIKCLEYNWVKAEDFLDTIAISKILDKTFISIEVNGFSDR